MYNDPPSRTYYSPVVCWTSTWGGGVLRNMRINKEGRAWQKAYDQQCVRKTNEKD
jgi:hypothetical protein